MSLADGYNLAKEYWPGLPRDEFEELATDYLLLRHEWDEIVGPGPSPPQAKIDQFFARSFGVILDLLRSVGPGGPDEDRALVVLGHLEGQARAPADVLDLGGGSGSTSIALARAGYRVWYSDLGQTAAFACWRFRREQLDIRQYGPTWFTGDYPTRPRRAWQAIICLDLLEHVERPLDLLRKLRTDLGPGGLLIGTLHAFVCRPDGWPSFNDWLQEQIDDRLEEIGFEPYRGEDPTWGIGAWKKATS